MQFSSNPINYNQELIYVGRTVNSNLSTIQSVKWAILLQVFGDTQNVICFSDKSNIWLPSFSNFFFFLARNIYHDIWR